jgi:hypothetical protein
MVYHNKLRWMQWIMFAAAVYNLCWGAVISVYPQLILFGNESNPFMLILIRCIGMLVGVYGIAYWFAGKDPLRYWPLIMVGFIGKVLGPIGSVYYVATGQLAAGFLWVNAGNDLIWLLPFGWVLWTIRQSGV